MKREKQKTEIQSSDVRWPQDMKREETKNGKPILQQISLIARRRMKTGTYSRDRQGREPCTYAPMYTSYTCCVWPIASALVGLSFLHILTFTWYRTNKIAYPPSLRWMHGQNLSAPIVILSCSTQYVYIVRVRWICAGSPSEVGGRT